MAEATPVINIGMESLERYAKSKLLSLETRNLRRNLVETARSAPMHVTRAGQESISFCCNDYLGLTHHPEVIAAAKAALDRYGAGAGGSRLVTGNHPLYDALETQLAIMKKTKAALVFGSGYLMNTGVIPALVNQDDLLIADRLCHTSLLAGARLAGSTLCFFEHNDLRTLENVLQARRAQHARCLVLTETVFSMDGDHAPVAAIAALAHAHDAWLLVDDAHGFGVMSSGDLSANLSTDQSADLCCGTLSKAVGSYGGYVCASSAVIEILKTRARTLVYSTALPPSAIAASLAALKIIKREPNLCKKPLEYAKRFCDRAGLAPPTSAIVPVFVGDEQRTLDAAAALQEHGFVVVAIRPPTVPKGLSRLRFTFCATHKREHIDRVADIIKAMMRPFESSRLPRHVA